MSISVLLKNSNEVLKPNVLSNSHFCLYTQFYLLGYKKEKTYTLRTVK